MVGLVSTLLLLAVQYVVLDCAKRNIKWVNKPYGIQMCRALCRDSPDTFHYIQEDLSCHRVSANYSAGSNRVSRKDCLTEGRKPYPESGCAFQRGVDVCNRKDKGDLRLTRSSTTAFSKVYPRTTALSPLYSRSSALSRVYPRTTALSPTYSRSTALSLVYPRTTTLSPIYSRSTALSQVYPRTTTLSSLYSRSTALSQVYPRTTTLSPLYSRSTALPEVYSRTTALSPMYYRSTALPDVYPRTTTLSPSYSRIRTLSSVPITTFVPPKGEPELKTNKCVGDSKCAKNQSRTSSRRCKVGMHFDPKTNKCGKGCKKYGLTMTMYKGFALGGHNDDVTSGITLEECKMKCLNFTKFVCKSIDYGKAIQLSVMPFTCDLSKVGFFEVGQSKRIRDKKWVLGVRNCEE